MSDLFYLGMVMGIVLCIAYDLGRGFYYLCKWAVLRALKRGYRLG